MSFGQWETVVWFPAGGERGVSPLAIAANIQCCLAAIRAVLWGFQRRLIVTDGVLLLLSQKLSPFVRQQGVKSPLESLMMELPGFQLFVKFFGGDVPAHIGNQPLLKRLMPKRIVDYDSLAEKRGQVAK